MLGLWRWAQCWAEPRKMMMWMGVSDLLRDGGSRTLAESRILHGPKVSRGMGKGFALALPGRIWAKWQGERSSKKCLQNRAWWRGAATEGMKDWVPLIFRSWGYPSLKAWGRRESLLSFSDCSGEIFHMEDPG